MKNNFAKRISSVLLVALSLSICCSAAFAAGVMPRTAYQSASYSIPQGETTWNGKNEGYLWTMTADETQFNISVTTDTEKTVQGTLYKVIRWGSDKVVQTVTLTGSNGLWNSSATFVPDTSASHYAVVTTKEAYGVNGRVSVQ